MELDEETKALFRESRRQQAECDRYWTGPDADTSASVGEMLQLECPHLTEAQRHLLTEKLEDAVSPELHKLGWLRNRLDNLVKGDASLIAKVPSVNALLKALGGDRMSAMDRVTKFRELSKLTEDERLAMMPAPVKTEETPAKAEEKSAPPAPSPYADDDACDDELARRLSYRDRFELRGKMLSAKLHAFRAALRKDAAPAARPSPNLGTAASAGIDVTIEAFRGLPPQKRLTAFRAAVGK